MKSNPMVTVFMTDFGVITLSDEFIAEAARRWPGSREEIRVNEDTGEEYSVTVPLWDDAIHKAVNAAAKDHFLRGPEHDLTRLDRLEDLAEWMEAA